MESAEAAKVSSSPLPRHSTRYFCVMANIQRYGHVGVDERRKGV